jgi:hypothetical protein
MLLAVPLAAALGVIVRFGLRRYLQSPIYTGATGRVATDDAPARRRKGAASQ